MTLSLFRIHADDSVATALEDLPAGMIATVGDVVVTLPQAIGRGHKVALRAIHAGDPVLKFGFPIGVATVEIAPGEHVHVHNVSTALSASGDYVWRPHLNTAEAVVPATGFAGYRRADGRVGTRNEIWIIPTV